MAVVIETVKRGLLVNILSIFIKRFQFEFDVCLPIFFVTLNKLVVHVNKATGFNEKILKKHAH